ncbi:MAG: Sir2 family NAD-dependent protein deacetylase [Bacteroidota bacterium]
MTSSTSNAQEPKRNKPLLVVMTGAGISAESGIPTFRDKGGIWDEYDLMEVGTAQGWQQNPGKVLAFVNDVKMRFADAKSNLAHQLIAQLEEWYEVVIITQNIDTLHEEAGSTRVIHIHGQVDKVRSTQAPYGVLDWPVDKELQLGDLCENGGQLRPHTVFFGEMVLDMDLAEEFAIQADIALVIGTSLQVMPAAGLILSVPDETPKILIDPEPSVSKEDLPLLEVFPMKATEGMQHLFERLKPT